jgi:hypothetical protein
MALPAGSHLARGRLTAKPEAAVMARAKAKTTGTHVGIISNTTVITRAQRDELRHVLKEIWFNTPGRLTLHHGCGFGADKVAHDYVRRQGGWTIHGHPACDTARKSLPMPQGMIRETNAADKLKQRYERDCEIARTAKILLVILSNSRSGPQVSPAGIASVLGATRTAGQDRRVIYIGARNSLQQARNGDSPQTRRTAPSRPAGNSQRTTPAKGILPREPNRRGNLVVPKPRPKDFPADWYTDAASAFRAVAEVQEDGTTIRVVLKVDCNVIHAIIEPRGRNVAARKAVQFNKDVAILKTNPGRTLVDTWR